MRALRRHHARRRALRTRRELARRSKGLYLPDDPELVRTVWKRDHCEQVGGRHIITPRRVLRARAPWRGEWAGP